MKLTQYHESRQRGSADFPMEYHYVDERHPRYQMPYHWHEEAEMLHVLQGPLEISLDDAVLALSTGDVLFIAPEQLHGGVSGTGEYECIVFDPRGLLRCGDPCRQQISSVMHRETALRSLYRAGNEPVAQVPRMFRALREKAPGCELMTLGALYQFCGGAYMAQDAAPAQAQPARRAQQLKRVFEKVEAEYMNPLTLADMASAAHMAPRYFCRVFRAATHRTPVDYLNEYRIGVASDQIAAGGADRTLTEIALDCGFSSLSYFIRQFRKYKGVTPGQYQAMMRRTVTAMDAFDGCNS